LAGRVQLKIVYVLTCRILGLVVMLARGGRCLTRIARQAKDTQNRMI
jgi:hypothetical protein